MKSCLTAEGLRFRGDCANPDEHSSGEDALKCASVDADEHGACGGG